METAPLTDLATKPRHLRVGVESFIDSVPWWVTESLRWYNVGKVAPTVTSDVEIWMQQAQQQAGVLMKHGEVIDRLANLQKGERAVLVGLYDPEAHVLGPIGFGTVIVAPDNSVPLMYITTSNTPTYRRQGLGTLQLALLGKRLLDMGIADVSTTVWQESRGLVQAAFDHSLGEERADGLQEISIHFTQERIQAILNQHPQSDVVSDGFSIPFPPARRR